MDITAQLNLIPVFSVLGLAVSRIADAITVVAFTAWYPSYYPVSFLVAGIALIPLILLFFTSHINSNNAVADDSAKRSRFAELYGLTRREEEIAYYIAQGKSNGEIASLVNLSESTIRFHVANILKKTGLSNRNEVSRAFHSA